MDCPRECTRRRDRRRQRATGEWATGIGRAERVLVLIAQLDDGATATVAHALAEQLELDHLQVEVALVDTKPPPPGGYDAVVIGALERYGDYTAALVDYVRVHHAALVAMPSAFFAVRGGREALPARIEHLTGWQPSVCVAIDAVDNAKRA